ncbi:MAG: energy-coupled thiamine transporter ThiT [Hornefia sp.]|nr:energy-coupled thiamine transporter ThiT [Hornefia sp.]
MQSFFESTVGKASVIAVIVFLLLLIFLPGRNSSRSNKPDVKALTISAVLIALAMILSQIKVYSMPYGGSVTLFSLLPIALCSYLLGTRKGVIAGIALGLVNLVFGPYVIHPAQLLLDYPMAFGAMGLGGFFRDRKNGLTISYLIGILGRYFFAVLSGVIFFASYAPEGFNALSWSLFYNGTYIFAEGAVTLAVINLPPVKRMFEQMKSQL